MNAREALAFLVLLLLGAFAGWSFADAIPQSPGETALAVCERAQDEHRLIYTLARCVKAETQNLEDY